MDKRFKPNIPVIGIVGAVFAPVGLLLIMTGLLIGNVLTMHAAEQADVTDALIFKLVFGGIGLLFFILGVIFLTTALLAVRKQQHVVETGQLVLADFDYVTEEPNVTVNGRHPVIAKLVYTDRFGGKQVFFSGRLMQDPTPQLTGRQVPVYVDPEHPENYYVDMQTALAPAKDSTWEGL